MMSTKERKEKAELSATGWIRENSNHRIPIVISKLISLFHGLRHKNYWNINGEEFQKFIKMPHQEIIKSKAFMNNDFDLEFQMECYPNGHIASSEGYMGYFLKLMSMPADIECVALTMLLQCKTNDGHMYDYKDLVEWKQEDIGNSDGWYSQPKTSDCFESKSICFMCHFDILYIKYTKESGKPNYIKDFKFPRQINYEWLIKGKELKRFKNLHPKIAITGESFGYGAFCLECIPNGDRIGLINQAAMFLRMLSLPFGVSLIEMQCELWRDDRRDQKVVIEMTDVRNSHGIWIGHLIRDSGKEELKLSVELEVLRVLDDDNNEIDKTEWSKYQIV